MNQAQTEKPMPASAYFFIQPWFHPDETRAGFHVRFSGPADRFDTALARLAAHPALPSLADGLPWFIPVDGPAAIAAADTFPARQVVPLIRASDRLGREALEARPGDGKIKPGLILEHDQKIPADGVWRHVVMSAGHARTLPAHCLAALSNQAAIAITGLRSRKDLGWATANHCRLVTGEYLLNRSAPCNKPDMLRLRLLNLLALIAQDADTREIEDIFRHEPKLAYGLLRLVNSAALAPRSPIASFSQAIAILGRQQLQRWLQLLVYADPNDGQHPNPLLLLAATRGKMMEALAKGPFSRHGLSADAAFMVGAFSLLDILFKLPMAEVLAQLPVPASIHAALEQNSGPLGELLLALDAADNYDFETAEGRLAALGIDGDSFMAAQLEALSWASDIRNPES